MVKRFLSWLFHRRSEMGLIEALTIDDYEPWEPWLELEKYKSAYTNLWDGDNPKAEPRNKIVVDVHASRREDGDPPWGFLQYYQDDWDY
jgi:hypothetical protein